MRNENGQNRCPCCNAAITAKDAPVASKFSQQLSPAQMELLEFADPLDGPDLVKSLQLLHDMALYHSQHPIDEVEKNALHSTKLLWERIAAITKGP